MKSHEVFHVEHFVEPYSYVLVCTYILCRPYDGKGLRKDLAPDIKGGIPVSRRLSVGSRNAFTTEDTEITEEEHRGFVRDDGQRTSSLFRAPHAIRGRSPGRPARCQRYRCGRGWTAEGGRPYVACAGASWACSSSSRSRRVWRIPSALLILIENFSVPSGVNCVPRCEATKRASFPGSIKAF